VPFQAYAAIKGFLESREGPWFRTPKTGAITDVFERSRFAKLFGHILGRPAGAPTLPAGRQVTAEGSGFTPNLALARAYNHFSGTFRIKPRHIKWVGNLALAVIIAVTALMSVFAPFIPATTSYASQPTLKTVEQIKQQETGNKKQEIIDAKNPKNKQSLRSSPEEPDAGLKEEILKNAQTEEITTPRVISKTTKGGKNLEFIFHQEPRVRVKLENAEVEFETKSVFGQRVNPQKSKIYKDKEVIYEEIVKDVDLKYSVTNDLLVEEFILKTRNQKLETGNLTIEQSVKTVDVKVVSPDPTTFGFYSEKEQGKELFKLSSPFAKDAKGETTDNLQLTLDKPFDFAQGYRLTKTLGESAKTWLVDPQRVYPVSIDPSVIVSGGIEEAEVQYGGLQRKVAYVNGNWYAFYNCDTTTGCSSGTSGKILFKKSSDGTTWTPSNGTDVDSTDPDNYNPSISVSGNTIIVFWVDDGANLSEGRTINTASADAQGTLCQLGTEASADGSFMVTVAAVSTTEAVVAISDFDAVGADFGVYNPDTLGGTCANNTTDNSTGNITFGSGLTAQDRPVAVFITGNTVDMIFQDGSSLLYSRYDASLNKWTRNKLTIASVTDNVYSVTTDGTTVWVLTVSGTTSTNFYKCCTDDFAETPIDSDAGGNGQDDVSDIDMFCPASTDCKIVYTDDIDTTAPTLIFADCNDETCSAPTLTTVDSDIGAAGDQAGVSIYCPAATDCKVVYGDDMDTTAPDADFVDCNDGACSAPTINTLDIDLGDSTSVLHTSIDCRPGAADCKFLYNDSGAGTLFFVDCNAAACPRTGGSAATITSISTSVGTASKNDLYCVAATNCKLVFYESVLTIVVFSDCADAACTSAGGRTNTAFDGDIGTTTGQSPVSIDCVGGDTDCKFIYGNLLDGATSVNTLQFVDCGDATCTVANATNTRIDSVGGAKDASDSPSVSLYCVSVTDCKFSYVGDLTSGTEKLYVVDCDAAACDSGSVISLPGPRFKGAISCVDTSGVASSTNCKFAYYEGTASTNPTVQFADCDMTNCFPSATSLTAPYGGSIAFDVASSAGNTNQSSLSWSHTTTSSSANRLMLVGVGVWADTPQPVSSVTYNGVNLTFLGSDTASGGASLWLYGMVNPATGTNTVTVNFSAINGGNQMGIALTWTGIDQSHPWGTFASARANSTTPSVNVTSASGETVVDVVVDTSVDGTLTVDASQTERQRITEGAGRTAMSSEAASGSPVTMSWAQNQGQGDGRLGGFPSSLRLILHLFP